MKRETLAPAGREPITTGAAAGSDTRKGAVHPADVAVALAGLSAADAWAALETWDASARAAVFSHLELAQQVDLSETLARADLAGLLAHMSPDDRVDLVQRLPTAQRETVLGAMARAEREDVRRLASYEDGTAGAAMTSDYVSLPPGLTAAEAIGRLRLEAPDKETIYCSYVVDGLRRLLGFVSLMDLILARPETSIADIMNREVIHARAADDQEDAARKIQKYDLIALPVVDAGGVLVGIVTHDDAMDILTQEQTEDLEKLMAISGPHEPGMYLRTSAWVHFRKRVPWIVALGVLGMVSGLIVEHFEGLLVQCTILAVFMPMLADTGGNTGSQSATLVVRALALAEIRPRDVGRVLLKELGVALPLGLVLSALALGRVLLLGDGSGLPVGISPLEVAVAIATALGLQVVTATLIGAALPLIAVRFGLDPAVVANPALTTVVDITGLLLFFAIASLMLGL